MCRPTAPSECLFVCVSSYPILFNCLENSFHRYWDETLLPRTAKHKHIAINQIESDREESGVILTDESYKKERDHELSAELVEDILSNKCINKIQRRYMRERYIYGRTYQEIATQYRVTRQAVQQSISNALKNLKKVINSYASTTD